MTSHSQRGLVLSHKMLVMSLAMKYKKTKTSLDYLFKSEHMNVQQMVSKVYQLEAMNELFLKAVDAKYHGHCHVCNLRDSILVVAVDSPTWMTPLRFELPDILQKLRGNPSLAGIIKIELKVQPPEIQQDVTYQKTLTQLSSETSKYYLTLAEDCDDPQLQQALRRIASHCDK